MLPRPELPLGVPLIRPRSGLVGCARTGQTVRVDLSSWTRRLLRFFAWVVVLYWTFLALAGTWHVLTHDDGQEGLALISAIFGLLVLVPAVMVLSLTRTSGEQARR